LAAVLLLAGCRPTGDSVVTLTPTEPLDVAKSFVGHLDEGRFDQAATLTRLDQMPLLALVEGAGVEEALGLLETGAEQVAANYWSGFWDTAAPAFGTFVVSGVQPIQTDESSFVAALPVDSRQPRLVLSRSARWEIDILASFGSGVAVRLAESAAALDGRRGADAEQMIELFRDQRASLAVALTDQAILPELAAELENLIEVIDGLGSG
jgi:hypothetical protein